MGKKGKSACIDCQSDLRLTLNQGHWFRKVFAATNSNQFNLLGMKIMQFAVGVLS